MFSSGTFMKVRPIGSEFQINDARCLSAEAEGAQRKNGGFIV